MPMTATAIEQMRRLSSALPPLSGNLSPSSAARTGSQPNGSWARAQSFTGTHGDEAGVSPPSSAVVADGRHSTLRQIASIHTQVDTEGRERTQKLDAS